MELESNDAVPPHRQRLPLRRITLQQEGQEDNRVARMSPGERIGLIEQLTIDAWAMMGEDVAQSRLQRHVVRIIGRGR